MDLLRPAVLLLHRLVISNQNPSSLVFLTMLVHSAGFRGPVFAGVWMELMLLCYRYGAHMAIVDNLLV